MISRELIKRVLSDSSLVEKQIIVKGWVRSIRNSKNFSFLVLNDGTSQKDLQLILDESLENYALVSKLKTGSSLSAIGTVKRAHGKEQGVEIHVERVEILGEAHDDYPLQKKATSLEFLRTIAHLRPRTNTFGAVFRIRHCLAQATHHFFSQRGFYYLNSPIITGVDAEGAGEVFKVTTLDIDKPHRKEGKVDYTRDYFGRDAYLCVTGQLEAECFACGMGAVYTFGPTFRSENSNTSRHLSEFWMVEPEMAFADLDEIADLAMDYIKFLIQAALKECPEEMLFFQRFYDKNLIDRLKGVLETGAKKITYTEAIDILIKSKESFEYSVSWDEGLQTEHERYLCEKHFNGPVIVTDYPKEIKAFYMRQNEDGKTVRAMDILVPGVGEIIGGSQREERYEVLKSRMEEVGLKQEDYDWYLDLRKYGTVEHSGFGLGFERAIMYITGISNIRDVIPFPRTPNNLNF